MRNDELAALPVNQPDDYDTLPDATKAQLQTWIAAHIRPATRPAPQTSYSLKHEFTQAPGGTYVTNGQFKGAMRAAGYEPVDSSLINWTYRIRYQP